MCIKLTIAKLFNQTNNQITSMEKYRKVVKQKNKKSIKFVLILNWNGRNKITSEAINFHFRNLKYLNQHVNL